MLTLRRNDIASVQQVINERSLLPTRLEENFTAKDLPWGTVYHSNELSRLLADLIEPLNETLNAQLVQDDCSIALAEITDEAAHGPYYRAVPMHFVKQDIEGNPLPVRIYIPLTHRMVFQIHDSVNDRIITVEPGELFGVHNGDLSNFSLAEPGRLSDYRFNKPKRVGRYLIIDIPPFFLPWDHMLKD